jgi:hypothetical protein
MNMVRVARKLRSLTAVGACFALTALLGCGGGNGTKASLTGKVTYNSAPVTGGTISLIPTSGASSGVPFPVTIKPDGTFDVGDAPMGPMKVTIETDSVSSAAPSFPMPKGANVPDPPKETGPVAKKVVIPPKYAKPETSGLTWDTKTEKTKNFNLTD